MFDLGRSCFFILTAVVNARKHMMGEINALAADVDDFPEPG
ncbi:hypothetical protein ACFO4L_14035 [Bacillus daqingensis]|uniref:Uncharacterized protein n=1 Tax=Bacillus daqingensis TaxID=872396 RepID=A0ABV9P0T7_9BACI